MPRTLSRTLPRLLALACVLGSCATVRRGPGPAGEPEAKSLFGQPLYSPEQPLEVRQRLEAQLDSARLAYEANPDQADAILWYGRRAAAAGHYRESISLFTEGIKKHPRDARFYRFRGHRWITVRRFDRAVGDLEHAVRLTRGQPDPVEPDVNPGPAGPLGTLQWNVWYHLGLAYYLRGEFARAAPAFRAALNLSRNDDSRVAAADWLYMSLRRLGRTADAEAVIRPFGPEVRVVENGSYLRRIRMYRGELPPDSLLDATGRSTLELATTGYGVGNWHLYNGRQSEAEAVFWRITSAENWAPFGYIAAEADLRRLTRAQQRRARQQPPR
ncbi:MAG: tetratricopeptide repeat protein [Longimicrobiaceae bacterium]